MTQRYHRLRKWAHTNRVEFNNNKVKCMLIAPHKKSTSKWVKRISERYRIYQGVYYRQPNNQVGQVELKHTYKYLGVIIDDKLNLNKWMKRIYTRVKERTNVISRLIATMQLGRKCSEILYNGYVRGYVNYGLMISSLHKNFVKIEVADRVAQRKLLGLLLLTSNDRLYDESNVELMSIKSSRSRLRFNASALTYKPPGLRRLLLAYELDEMKSTSHRETYLEKLAYQWQTYGLPLHDNEPTEDAFREVCQEFGKWVPKKKRDKWKYRECFYEERMLARMRVGVLPTERWAWRLKQVDTPACRHCGNYEETIEHLFEFKCEQLNYHVLVPYLDKSWEDMRRILNERMNPSRVDLESRLLEFVQLNDVFRIIDDDDDD